MSAEVHSEPSCIELNRVRQENWFGLVGTACCAVRTSQRDVPTLQLDHLRRVNVIARPNFAKQLFARGGVKIQHSERGTAGLISAE